MRGDKPHAVSDELMPRVRSGAIRVAGPVVELAGDCVRLAGGTVLPAGAILYGTGISAPNASTSLMKKSDRASRWRMLR